MTECAVPSTEKGICDHILGFLQGKNVWFSSARNPCFAHGICSRKSSFASFVRQKTAGGQGNGGCNETLGRSVFPGARIRWRSCSFKKVSSRIPAIRFSLRKGECDPCTRPLTIRRLAFAPRSRGEDKSHTHHPPFSFEEMGRLGRAFCVVTIPGKDLPDPRDTSLSIRRSPAPLWVRRSTVIACKGAGRSRTQERRETGGSLAWTFLFSHHIQ